MGRKIPGKKHKGIKDPEEQRRRRYESIKHKINQPPKDPDDQEIPAKLKKMIENKIGTSVYDKVQQVHQRKRYLFDTSKHNKDDKQGLQGPMRQLPEYKERQEESDHSFMNRGSAVTQVVLDKIRYENTYNVDVHHNPVIGKTGIRKQKLSEIEQSLSKRVEPRKEKLKKKKDRKMKKNLKKESKRRDKVDDFSSFQDKVQLGEVVHQPPQLTTKLKKTKNYCPVNKPDRRQLLLQNLLTEDKLGSMSLLPMKSSENHSGRRKYLSVAARKHLKAERDNMAAAYRLLKQKNKMVP